jgi:aryl-alcohol dehydrogenase-like predicted oxidoreductase
MAGVAGMSAMYGPVDMDEAIATIHRAIDLGIDLLRHRGDLRAVRNEELLGRAVRGRRDGLVIATKFGFRIEKGARRRRQQPGERAPRLRGKPEAARRRGDRPVLPAPRRSRAVPIEETVGRDGRSGREGKVRFSGSARPRRRPSGARTRCIRSPRSSPNIRCGSERSRRTILPLCRELGIGFVPYSPLGRGFLTGQVRRAEDYETGDYRRNDPRYQGANFDSNMRAVAAVGTVAARHGATSAQVALAWLLHQGEDIVPIPGTKRRDRLEENAGAASLRLTRVDLDELDAAAPVGATAGPRYGNPAMLAMVRR